MFCSDYTTVDNPRSTWCLAPKSTNHTTPSRIATSNAVSIVSIRFRCQVRIQNPPHLPSSAWARPHSAYELYPESRRMWFWFQELFPHRTVMGVASATQGGRLPAPAVLPTGSTSSASILTRWKCGFGSGNLFHRLFRRLPRNCFHMGLC